MFAPSLEIETSVSAKSSFPLLSSVKLSLHLSNRRKRSSFLNGPGAIACTHRHQVCCSFRPNDPSFSWLSSVKILRRIKQKETKFLFELKLNQAATCCIGDCFRPANDVHLGKDAFHM